MIVRSFQAVITNYYSLPS